MPKMRSPRRVRGASTRRRKTRIAAWTVSSVPYSGARAEAGERREIEHRFESNDAFCIIMSCGLCGWAPAGCRCGSSEYHLSCQGDNRCSKG